MKKITTTLSKLAALVIILSLGSCSSTEQGAAIIEQGEIVYDLSYPQFGDDNLIASMFPSSMSFKFKDNMTRSDLKTRMAVFSTTFVTDKDNRTLTHLVKIASKKSGLILDSADIMKDYAKKPEGMQVTLTDSTKSIAGFTCKHALVTFDDKPEKTFDLYYTEEIAINDPNWCSPYQEIPGVLMQARVKKFNIEMQITASEVVASDYDSAEFVIPNDFEPITPEEMADIFQSF
ncbi:MAG: GLPGLI family protein [Granulosicoccus sp.]|jgi:GLPGLI family protein